MNANAPGDRTHMDETLDTLMRKLDALSLQVDAATDRLLRKDVTTEQSDEKEEEGSP
jgi:hypothetical protein